MFELDPVTDLLLCFALGLGALVVGVLAFFFGRRVRPATWVVPLGLGLCFAAPALGLAVTGQDSSSLLPLALLASYFGSLAAARTPLITGSVSSRFAGLLRRGRVAPTCLVALGLGLIGRQVFAIDRQQAADIEMADSILRKIAYQGAEPIPGALAWTDKGREVQLMRMAPDPAHDDQTETTYFRSLGLEFKVIRTAPWDESYNCHGWVFGAGQVWIGGVSVDTILEDNGYHTVSKPVVGDVVVFRDAEGKVGHSAVVRAIPDDGRVLLESKWGKMGRYLHPIDQHAYSNQQATFYHSSRAGHELHKPDSKPGSMAVR